MSERLNKALERLTPEQRALLAKRMLRKRAPEDRAIPRRREDGPVVASFGQERLWFLEQLEPGSPAYHLTSALWVEGALDVEALRRSLRSLVRRHEVLRTTFRSVEGQPVQIVDPDPRLELEPEPAGESGAEDREQRARAIVQEEIRRPYDLERGPLLRARLVVFTQQRHLLVIGLHHIVTDGWSQGILMRELSALYDAYHRDASVTSARLPELPIQYADFALWQRRWLAGEVLEEQLAYWRKELRGVPALELPADRPRPRRPSYRGGVERLMLPDEVVRPLTELDRAAGTTPFMALLAAFAGLLFRLTGQRDFAVGSSIANRRRPELEGLIGLFINVLALRVDLGGDPGYRQLLARVREVALEAYGRQDVPFEKLVDELAPERDLGRSPVFQVLFALQNMERRPLALAGAEARPVTGGVSTTRFDLELYAWELDDDWGLMFVYNADLFEAPTVRRLARHFGQLLRAALAEPDAPLAELSLLTAAERHQALVEDSDTERQLPAELQVHRQIALRAAKTPDALAVVGGDRHLTYRGLAARSRALARRLRRAGAGGGALVGLCALRGPDMVAALLAVLEAGAAYVPLDPALPADRLAFMAEDAGLAALVCERQLAAREPAVAALAETVAGAVLWLGDGSVSAEVGDADPAVTTAPDELAYVIYTSGSTGRPKGVQLTHRNVVNFLQSMAREPGLAAGDTVLAVTTLSFDIAVLELLLPLMVGARTVIASSAEAADGEALAALLRRSRVSLMQATPATWQLLVQIGWDGEQDLKMISGGEALPRRLAAELVPRGRELWNLYGPTETTVWSAATRIGAGDEITLGHPVDNTGLLVLDPRLRPVARGVSGQLAITGAGLARGYLRRPALTAGAFCPDPNAGDGERLYLTGDLVRRDVAGRLVYLGRLDHQVKLRGFRIELGEIEAALEALPAVGRAVALLHEAGAGADPPFAPLRGDRLVAFLVSPGDGAPAEPELRAHLALRLPDYMIPAAFLSVAELPLTPSGKVDRKALGRQASELPAAVPEAREAPRGPIEEAVAAAFGEVLGREGVGRQESFFTLGGHSLLATRLLFRLRTSLELELPLRAVFESPTVVGLAAQLEAVRGASAELEVPAIEAAEREGALPLSFGQERLWFLEQLEPGSPAYHMAMALWIEGPLEPEALRRSLGELVRRHEALRTTFSASGGVPSQKVAVGGAPALVVESAPGVASGDREQQAAGFLREEVTRSFDLERGPPLRARLVAFGDHRHLFVLCLHHIVTDAWSQGILARELSALYAAYRRDPEAESPLPELPIQYGDFALWQRRWLAGEVLERQLAFWKERLAGVPALELPADHARPAAPSYRGGVARLRLEAGVVDSLAGLDAGGGTTPFMALLAGYSALLSRLTGQADFAVGSPVANRRRPELEGMIGLFINVLALRVDLGGDPSYRRLLGRAREVALAGFGHQDLPFEKLVDELAPERHLSRSPLFQVLFALQNVEGGPLALAGTETRAAPGGGATTRFDLELYAWERSGDWYLSFVYNADLFEAVTVGRLARHFGQLLRSARELPDAPLSALLLLSPAERHQALVEDADTARRLPADSRIHRLIAHRSARTPEAVAVAGGGRQLTYGGLAARSRALAARLRRSGVGAGSLVGLCVERGPEMVASLLAVLESGAAYVPLDPALPADRLEYMAGDAGLAALISERYLAAREPAVAALAETVAGAVLWLDDGSVSAEVGDADPAVTTVPDELAYVIYTSGSTGRPKGVQLTHRNVVNFLQSMAREPGLGAGDTVLAVTTLSFDIAVLELLLPLAVGAKTVIATSAEAADGEALAGLLRRSRVSLMQATPATWQLLVQIGWDGEQDLKMISGGEALPRRLAAELVPRGRELWNLYGPTETTVWSAATRITAGDDVTLGLPIDNTGLLVLDPRLRPVAQGGSGQLAISGAGLARGYLRRPALTAGAFCPDPFAGDGARLYLTGDLVRRDVGGRLVYLGRLDHQIKLRGFRIELGEIEAALEALPAIERAVVLLHEASAGDDRLIAFLVSAASGAPSEPELRAHLASRLPDYMIPSAYARVADLPLTPSGKVDRKALKRQASEAAAAGSAAPAAQEAPRGPVEEAVAAAFGEVLGRPAVGARDHFFELGGHSLLATRLLSRVCDIFRVDLPLSTLFTHPTVASLAAQVEQARRGQAADQYLAIEPVPRDRGVPRDAAGLSFAQRRLWFLDQLGAGAGYNIKLAFRLDGELETGALLESLRRIVERHETLRASFPMMGGEPRQVVSGLILPAAVVDLSALGGASRRRQLQGLAFGLEQSAFDLARGPLLQAVLARCRRRRNVLLLVVHHIAFDGWSMGIFRRELASHYRAIIAGQPPLPEFRIQYLDYVAWQQARLDRRALERELAYWKTQLGDGGAGRQLPVVELPTDRPRPPVQTFRGDSRWFRLSPATAEALAELSRRQGVTPAMLLLSGFKVLLARTTGQSDLVVGSPIAGRLRSELEALIGFFANTIVLRSDFSGSRGGPTFSECLRRVQRVSLAAYDHQEMPFDLLVDELETERDPSRNPIFQIAFAFQHVTPEAVDFPGLEVQSYPIGTSVARMDLELFLFQGPSGLAGQFVYNTDLFDATTIARLAGHFRRLLASAAADPELPIRELELLGPAERHQLRSEWNATVQPFAAACLHEMIAAEARAAPDRVAVVFEGQAGDHQLTYGELDARANRLAHTLRAEGVGVEERVALCVERGAEMIIALLGIWKAGGAYVPLDPDYPPDRLAFMLRDCRARVLLSQEALLAGLPEPGVRVLCLDRDRRRIASAPVAEPRSGANPDQLAYVIYTSGSTGTPKGALLSHRGLASLAAEQARTFGTGPDSRVLQYSSLSFDASTFEIVMALTAGATLAFGRRQELLPGPDLVAFLDRQRISIVLLPPAALAPLPAAPLPALATITTGGEACPPELPARWAPGRRFFNLYGPTEATIVSTMTELAGDKPPWIGRPLANTQAYLLDSRLRPVPVGVSGELLVSGVSLARGYLGRPALTAERFVPAPSLGPQGGGRRRAQGPGARLYRTGDLTRYRPDGEIEFLGRIDHQVKLRGYRIELGEIEARLETHPAVEQAVVVLHEAGAGDRRLVAFLVPAEDLPAADSELRSHLASKLPDYMVPADYLAVAELPLNPSGKVDRSELARRARPALDARRQGQEVAAPRGAHELQLVSLWEQVLQRNPIGVTANFFDLGGSSLLAIRLFALIEQTFGQTLPISTLFRAPTIAQLAGVLRQEGFQSRWSSIVPIHPWGQRPPLFCAHGETGDPFIYRHLAEHLGADQPLYGLLSRGLDQQTPPFTRMEEMAAHYLSEMRQIQPHGPYYLGGFCFGGIAALEIARQLIADGEEIALLAAFDAPAPISDALPRRVVRRYQRYWLRKKMEYQLEIMQPLPLAEKVGFLATRAARLTSRIGARLRRRKRSAARSNAAQKPPGRVVLANRVAAHQYRPGFYPGRVTVFRSVGSLGEVFLDPLLGWQVLAQGRVELREIPGSHHTMFDEPNVEFLAAGLKQCLEGVEADEPPGPRPEKERGRRDGR